VLSSEQEYLDRGRFSPEKMIRFLQEAHDTALSDGMTALRATGDVSWEIGPNREFQQVVTYEAMLDDFFSGKQLIGMCQYPREACPPGILSGILTTHKVAAIDSEFCANPHYLPPRLLLEKDLALREKRRAEWMTSQLVRVRRAEEQRDQLQAQLF